MIKYSRCNAITNIIDSVAEEQRGLAQILEAEADKIKHVISCSNSNDEILAVNDSVQSTISSITKLEIVLSNKIEIFKDCVCTCNETNNYSTLNMEIQEDNGSLIEKENDQVTFRFTHGTTDTHINFITDPNTPVVTLSELPEGFTFTDNTLTIPEQCDWTRSYYITFQVGEENNSYEVKFITEI